MQQKGYTFESIARFMSERRLVITAIALRNHLQRATAKRAEQSGNRPRGRSTSRDVPQRTSRPDATATGQVSTGGASGEPIPIASGTPSGASPAATAERSLVQKDAAKRTTREPRDGATATRTTEHRVSTAASELDATASGSVSTGGASGEPIPIASGTASGTSPAATVERALAQKDAATRSAREPSDGATATRPTEHGVSTAASDADATASSSVSTGGASGERIPIASGTASGASPAATAERSLVQKDAATRSAREPGDGATATRTTEHSVSTAAPDPDAMASSSVSTGGASGEPIPIASGTPSGASPAATAERPRTQQEGAARSAREPSDGATATHPTEHSVSSSAPDPDATASGSVSTGGASGERTSVLSGTLSGASPAATVERSVPRQESATRSAPGATAVRTTERSVSTSASQPHTMAGGSASAAGASGHAIPIAPATADGAPSGGIVRGSVAERESAVRVARGTREGKAPARSPAGVREGPARQSEEATGSGGSPSPSATSEPAKPAEEKHRGMFEVRKDTDDL